MHRRRIRNDWSRMNSITWAFIQLVLIGGMLIVLAIIRN